VQPPGRATAPGAAAFRRRALALVLLGLGVAAPAGFVASDRLEQDNDFCTSCHLSPGVPLHRDLRRDFDADPARNLAGAHARAGVEAAGSQREFRCFDCHGGTSLHGRLRSKALAVRDGFWYVLGRFEEPTGMTAPLWDEDCVKCHAGFDESEPADWESPRFHQLPVHNAELGVACVECHQSHVSGGDADAHFIAADTVRSQCARCHAEFD
jgi:nitrate/TMAO reductase-like tetraheme cytochrome c subunit